MQIIYHRLLNTVNFSNTTMHHQPAINKILSSKRKGCSWWFVYWANRPLILLMTLRRDIRVLFLSTQVTKESSRCDLRPESRVGIPTKRHCRLLQKDLKIWRANNDIYSSRFSFVEWRQHLYSKIEWSYIGLNTSNHPWSLPPQAKIYSRKLFSKGSRLCRVENQSRQWTLLRYSWCSLMPLCRVWYMICIH